MKIKKLYYYFIYKIYKAVEYTSELSGVEKFMTSFKTGVIVIALEFLFTISLLNYYNIFIDRTINFPKSIYISIALFFAILTYITIDFNDAMKKYYEYFSKQSIEKNKIGNYIVLGIVGFIIISFIYSIYLISQIDWQSL